MEAFASPLLPYPFGAMYLSGGGGVRMAMVLRMAQARCIYRQKQSLCENFLWTPFEGVG